MGTYLFEDSNWNYYHLTIDKAELTEDFCPECYDRVAVRRRDFEVIGLGVDKKAIYCCEKCGIRIEV